MIQNNLKDVLLEFEKRLLETEESFVQDIIDLTNKPKKIEKRKKKNGLFQSIKNWFYGLFLRIYNSKLNRNLREYETQKHLEKKVEEYMISVKNVISPHKGWYNIFIPQLDLEIVKNEFLTPSEVYKEFGMTEKQIKSLVEGGQISFYEIQKRRFFKKSELEKTLPN